MPLDTKTLSSLSRTDRLDVIVKHLKSIPLAQRPDAIESIQRGLKEPESSALTFHWPLYARDSQLPPDGDWDTWLILAGRGFGKTRTGAEWIRSQVEDKKPAASPSSPALSTKPSPS